MIYIAAQNFYVVAYTCEINAFSAGSRTHIQYVVAVFYVRNLAASDRSKRLERDESRVEKRSDRLRVAYEKTIGFFVVFFAFYVKSLLFFFYRTRIRLFKVYARVFEFERLAAEKFTSTFRAVLFYVLSYYPERHRRFD